MSQPSSETPSSSAPSLLTAGQRYLILTCAFLGWACAGMQMSMTSLAMRPAAISLLSDTGAFDLQEFKSLNSSLKDPEKRSPLTSEQTEQVKSWNKIVGRWFSWYICAFLFGAAAGGFGLGRVGDRFGRAKGMSLSIILFSGFSGAAYFAQTPEQLLILRFLACTGIGGMWPNGVALAAEAWSSISRPMLAGVIGTAANVGIMSMAYIGKLHTITPDDWRWVLLVGLAPIALGLFSLVVVPESPRWLASKRNKPQTDQTSAATSNWDVFRKPLLTVTLVGIALGTVPLIGGWGSSNWVIPWADKAGAPELKADIQLARSITGTISSLLGGWLASLLGRKRCYFLTSLGALICAQYPYWFLVPTDSSFLYWMAGLGFFSGVFFGWLPLCLPEMFPTSVRSTGAGVSFNFGRILSAVTVFLTGILISLSGEDYALIGRITSLIYAVGLIVIWFAPIKENKSMDD